MDYILYYLLGVALLIFLGMQIVIRKKKNQRKSRDFMDGYKRKDKQD